MLVDHAVAGEEAGFDFVSISDHLHPWVAAQGHSPFVWSVLGALSRPQPTSTSPWGDVTFPLVRVDPVVVAQPAATTSPLRSTRTSWPP